MKNEAKRFLFRVIVEFECSDGASLGVGRLQMPERQALFEAPVCANRGVDVVSLEGSDGMS